MRPMRVAAVLACSLLLCVSSLAQSDPALEKQEKELRQQLLDEETALATARIYDHYLDCSDATGFADFQKFGNATAKRLDVTGFEIKPIEGTERIALGDGGASPFAWERYEIHGSGELAGLQRLLRNFALFYQKSLDINTLHIKAEPAGAVSFTGRVARVCWTGNVEIPRPPRTVQGAAYVMALEKARLQFLRSANAAVRDIGARVRAKRLTTAIGQLAEQWGDRPVALNEFEYSAPVLTLKGIASGASARASIDAGLRVSGFEVVKVDTLTAGCGAFTATARLLDGSEDDVGTKDLFDDRTPSAICAPPSSPPAIPVLLHGSGQLTLHLHDSDIPNLFMVLDDLLPEGEGFIVEPDVTQRVSIDADGATPDEIFAALQSAHVVYVGPGPLHRVCAQACTPSRNDNYTGEPVTFTVKNADAADVFRTFAKAAGLNMDLAPDVHAKLSIFTRKMPWDRVVMSIIDSLHLHYTIDNDTHRLYIGRDSDLAKPDHRGTVDIAKVPFGPFVRRMSEGKLENLGVEDIRLAALARSQGTRWTAYVSVPGPEFWIRPIEPGTKLFDGTAESVDEHGVTLRSANGQQTQLAIH